MKKIGTLFPAVLLGAVGLSQPALAQVAYTPVAVTGYTADVIANGSGTVASSTSATVDRGNAQVRWCFADSTFVSPSGATARPALPNNGFFRSFATSGLTFQMGPSSGNNSLRIDGSGQGTLTLVTPRACTEVVVLATEGNGSSAGKTFTVTFTDGTMQTFSNIAVPDWFGTGATSAITVGSRVNRVDNSVDNNGGNPKIWEVRLTLNVGNYTKLVQSITAQKSSTDPVLNVMGVSLGQACGLPTGTVSASALNICSGDPTTLSFSTQSLSTGYITQWQSSLNGTTWTNIAGATGLTYTANPTVTTRYRLYVTCGTGIALFGPVTVNVAPANSTLTYALTSFCQNASAGPLPTFTPAGGTFAAPTGLSINATTGIISPSASTPGTYAVTYTPATCTAPSTATVTVAPVPVPVLAYGATAFCQDAAAPTPTFSPTGGTFSSTPGLLVNPTTGSINLTNSVLGTYVVTYSVPGQCPAAVTQTVTVAPPVTVSVNYNGTEFCKAGTNPTPAAAPTGGTFSSPNNALVIDPATGTIDVAKTPAGAYTISYTVANQCATAVAANVRIIGNDAPIYPNIITPGTDKLNDALKLTIADVQNYKLQVFNRWGRMVFESANPTEGWTAAENSGGMYFYRVQYTDCANRAQEVHNWIEVIK